MDPYFKGPSIPVPRTIVPIPDMETMHTTHCGALDP